MFETLHRKGFQLLALHHAKAILRHDMSQAVEEIEAVLSDVSIPVEELVRGGGGEGQLTQRMRRALGQAGWTKHSFEIKKIIDGKETESISHEIDHANTLDAGRFVYELRRI